MRIKDMPKLSRKDRLFSMFVRLLIFLRDKKTTKVLNAINRLYDKYNRSQSKISSLRRKLKYEKCAASNCYSLTMATDPNFRNHSHSRYCPVHESNVSWHYCLECDNPIPRDRLKCNLHR